MKCVVGGAKGGKANLLREVSELGVSEQRNVANQLVAHIGLRSVHWLRMVTNVSTDSNMSAKGMGESWVRRKMKN
jgi:hypothetical protein